MHFAEQVRQRPRQPPGAAADLQNAHVFGIFTLADIDHVRENVVGNGLLAGREELFIGPIGIPGGNVVAGVFSRTLIPIALHFFQLLGLG